MTIDAHHHFWRYDPVEYGWIPDEASMLRRDFLPRHLEREIEAAGVSGVVSVQARQTLGETRALLAMARRHDFILGVVGWVPLVDSGVAGILERFAEEPRLKACRHVLQEEPDDDYMLGTAFNRGIRALTAAGLVYDILIFERHLPQTIRFVDRHPEQDFVLNHIGKPRIRDGSFADWNRRIRDLARRPRIRCKMSGLATEAAWGGWTEEQFLPYLDAVLEAFGPDRLMFGSDWPVSLPAVGYGRWVEIVRRYVSTLAPGERRRILSGTAIETYGLDPAGPGTGA